MANSAVSDFEHLLLEGVGVAEPQPCLAATARALRDMCGVSFVVLGEL